MSRLLREYANIRIEVLPFEDYSTLTVWLREPGGPMRRFGEHRSYSLDMGREDFTADDPSGFLIALAAAIRRTM